MKPSLAGAVVLVSLVTTACAGPGATGRAPSSDEAPASSAKAPPASAEARASLRAADAALADAMVRQGAAEGLAASAAGDAVLLLPGRYALHGAEAIRTGLAAEPMAKEGVLSAGAVVWNVSADGQLGYTMGQVRLRSDSAGTTGTSAATGTAGTTGTSAATGTAGTTGTAAATGTAGTTGTSAATGTAAAAGAPGAGAHSTRESGTAPRPGAPSPAAPAQHHQRYVAVWTRTPEGPWRLAAITLGRPTGPLQVPPSFTVVPAPAPPATPRAPADVLAEAFAADSAFSAQSAREGMGIAFGAWAAPDAVIPNGPGGYFGHDAIESGYAPATREQVDLRWEPRLGGAASSGDLAYTVGRAVSVAPGPEGKPDTRYTKYLSIWRRQPDGQWRYVADGGNGSPGPDGP